jgi:hypothetical protein
MIIYINYHNYLFIHHNKYFLINKIITFLIIYLQLEFILNYFYESY